VNTTKTLAHRLRRVRAVVLRAELALTIAQILSWISLIGVPVGLALWAHHRRTPNKLPDWGEAGVRTSNSGERPAPEADDELPSASQQ
jgi:hypothetical protein